MSQRRDVSPGTLPVEIEEDAVTVEYLDGRAARYGGPIERLEGSVRCAPGKEVHVLVTRADADRGVMIYVNDRNTDGEILEDTGVGRVVLEPGEESELLPGVVAFMDGHVVEVVAEPGVAGGRVFVFIEDELGERAVELVGA
ncbi:MAG: DUF5796 family protein [Halobacteriales archaeon]|nr:DUF5796 family protein [Halobacteriales archaeon]